MLVLAALFFFLWLVSSEGPAYADNEPEVIDPGDGGGGNYPPPPPHTIEGIVLDPNGTRASGVKVYLWAFLNDHWTTTNATGGFRFQGDYIHANVDYEISVNG